MIDLLISSLENWNKTKTERQKMQQTYLVLTVVIVLFAGIASLLDAVFGHNVVKLALIALGAFATNAVVWNLLQASLLNRLSSRSKRKK